MRSKPKSTTVNLGKIILRTDLFKMLPQIKIDLDLRYQYQYSLGGRLPLHSSVHFYCNVSVFEQYQKSRTQFVQTVAELATRPQNIEILQNAGVMSLLRPLLLDIVPTIQQTAALALGRLANYNDDLAEAVVKGDILPQLVYSLAEQNVSETWLI